MCVTAALSACTATTATSTTSSTVSRPPTTTSEATPTSTTSTTAPEPADFLDVGAVPSVLEGFPIPANATEIEPLTTDTAADGYFETEVSYVLSAPISGGELLRWFDEEIPPGAAFGGWAWCEDASAGSDRFFIHVWAKPGTAEVLGFTIQNIPGSPTEFTIFKELSGPC